MEFDPLLALLLLRSWVKTFDKGSKGSGKWLVFVREVGSKEIGKNNNEVSSYEKTMPVDAFRVGKRVKHGKLTDQPCT